jgi:DNA-binding transcriptional ArsR family regulator/precorrin-6B methylase 2
MDDLSERAEFMRMLADPTRLRLLKALRMGELTVAEITRVTGLSQPRVSRHLRLLSEAGLLARTPDQNEVYYRLAGRAEHAALVESVLDSLRDGATLRQDHARLESILDERRETARQVLAHLGIQPLSPATAAAVSATINDLLDRHLAEAVPRRALDLGTGSATLLRMLGRRASTAVGLDLSREMRIVARAALLSEGLANCSVQAGNMLALAFEAASFDLVSIDRALGAIGQPDVALLEAARVLRPGGHLLVIETDASDAYAAQLTTWLENAGLRVLEARHPAARSALVALATRPALAFRSPADV